MELTFQDLLSPANDITIDPTAPDITVWAGFPAKYLHQDAKITLEHNGTYHKGYLQYYNYSYQPFSRSTNFVVMMEDNTI